MLLISICWFAPYFASPFSHAHFSQDNLFSEEISRNPDFAHLARGRSAAGTGSARARAGAPNRVSRSQSQGQHQQPDIDIMKSLGDLGNSARRRLQMLASQFNARTKQNTNTAAAASGSSTNAERRGLLSDDLEDDVALEFATRKDD